MDLKTVEAFAKKQGYETVNPLEPWRGYDVYEPVENDGEIAYIGTPMIILVKGNEIRMSTLEEAYQQLKETADNDE